jgi:hypothetical protein
MVSSRSDEHFPPRLLAVTAALGGWLIAQAAGWAAETADPVPRETTSVILRLDAEEPLAIRTKFQASPPVITIEFPSQRVGAAIPERATVSHGVVQSVSARYESGPTRRAARSLRSLHISLRGSYPYRVRSEPGRIIVDIDHPASVGASAVDVGLKGVAVIGGLGPRRVTERFRAMQEALARAAPIPWSLQVQPSPAPAASPSPSPSPSWQDAGTAAPGTPPGSARPGLSDTGRSTAGAVVTLFALAAALAGLWRLATAGTGAARFWARRSAARAPGRLPSGLVLIDQLVWKAFERQGYQVVSELERAQPLSGILRVITKNGMKTALMFIGNGPFLEKQTVERFIEAMRQVDVEEGFLVASGSFTVPAQRIAKEYRVTLIGREQLAELLSAGAASEFLAKQLEQQQARLDEAKETLRQYAAELDTLRAQRNEASWYLGEERAKTGRLDAQLAELTQQVRHHEAELERWKREASTLRKQWEESEWYLGEARERVRFFEGQLGALQELKDRAEALDKERSEAQWYVGEERAKREALEVALADLQRHLEAANARQRELQEGIDGLRRELEAIRSFGERRRTARIRIPQAFLEVHDDGEQPVFSGSPRDVSGSGLGFDVDRALTLPPLIRLRLNLPGVNEPIDSRARIVWQRADARATGTQIGCQLLDVPAAVRTYIRKTIEEQSGATPDT